NFANSPKLNEHRNAFDSRLDINFSQKDTLFYRFSFVDDPQLIPSIFGGIADGGGFQQGTQTANAQQSALGYTHTFSPTLVNVARAGLNDLLSIKFSQQDTPSYRCSFVDDPQLIPSIFGGSADGGGFQQGTQTANAQQSALGYTHTFSPTLVNVARAGLNYLHTSRYSPEA